MFSVALNLATVLLLAATGVLVLRRHGTSGASRVALRMFAAWWFSAAGVVLLAGSHTILALVGITATSVHLAIAYATAFPLAIGLWALLYYLIFIYTGRAWALWPLTIAYLLFLGSELYYFSQFGDRSLVENAWQIQFVGSARPPEWMSIAFGALVALPILLAIALYAGLYRSTSDARVRRRIGLLSTAFGIWFGVVLLAFVLGWDRADWFPLTYEAPGFVAGILIVIAYSAA